ncbi:MAG: deoxyribose-phosphate aldolase [bacterium]|nr:MAG: deoxyribose-phosphate aldolase [bacterium]
MSTLIDTKSRKITMGADHAGYELKEKLKKYLIEQGHTVFDCGTFSTESVDYPAIAYQVARLIGSGEYELGIIVDGAGIGSAMTANKLSGVRAALCYDVSTARNSREHNDANVLTLGAGLIGFELAKQIVDIWLSSECTVDRHLRRVKMIGDIEKRNFAVNLSSKSNPHSSGLNITDEDIKKIASKIQLLLNQQNLISSPLSATCDSQICNSCGQCADKASDAVRQFINMGVSRVSNAPGGIGAPQDIARYIDHTILKPEATVEDIKKLCQEAVEYQFAAVCINPTYVKLAHDLTKGSGVKVCTVVGFPLGTHIPEIKAMEARRAIREGAKEIDMVINIGALKSGDNDLVLRDIRSVVEACVDGSATCKVIIEAALLNDDEKMKACELSKKARAHYVKTSTGFGPGGATAHDVALMSKVVSGTTMGVKAAGGISTLEDAQKMIEAGATRIGASAGVKIVHEAGQVTES